jgi:prephenate dehydrogenase
LAGKEKWATGLRFFFENQGFKVIISDKKTKLSNIEAAKKADIVIVSVPISQTAKVIREIRDFLKKDSLLCDIASLKTEPVRAMRKAKSGAMGMHPLFGPLTQSLEGQKIIFCPVRQNFWSEFLREIFIKNKAEIIEVSPEKHDKQMAIVQALVHFANIGLARTFYSQKIILQSLFLTPVFRLQSLIIGRILAQNPGLLAELEINNPYFRDILSQFQKQIEDLAEDVKERNFRSFIKKFKRISLYLDEFRKVSEIKSAEVLKIIERQPVKEKRIKNTIKGGNKLKVGFLGPKGTFSHQAAAAVFSAKSKLIPCRTIAEIFEKVHSQEINLGIVPAENTTGG